MSLTAFASRTPAAYIKGTVFADPITNSADMLAEANLDNWNVRLRLIETDARSATESFEVVRTNPFDGGVDRLGISGERYVEFQNETVFGLFDHLGVEWESAGQFRNGALVVGQAKSDVSIVIDPNGAADKIEPFIFVTTGHGGKGALRIGRTAMRFECMNQFNIIVGNLKDSVTIRHTKSGPARMQELVRAWKGNAAYFAAIEEEANTLYGQKVTNKQFWAIVDQFMGDRPDVAVKGNQTKWDNSREAYAQAWNGKPNEKAKGTAWGVFNALIERNQWGRTIQKTTNGVENFALAGMGFDIPTNTFRQKAYEAAKSLVTV